MSLPDLLGRPSLRYAVRGGEEGQPQQFLVRATFSSISRPSHLKILVFSILFFLSVSSSQIKLFLKNRATLGHKRNIEFL